MSSFGRYVPISLAIVFGIFNGYYAFNGPLKAQHEKSVLPDVKQKANNSSESANTKQS
ncbi:hypothetical protein F5X96DRAFT_664929 [Biscogniauxia mediterranea]|nr:hypothetical protein F5X96DRAFT_664929 [Biscogniauxia mediterranea]